MSNQNCFKCLVQFKELKYCVILKNVFNFNEITFNSVLNEIQIQTKQNISYETHSFEIFDNDFNEYVLIISDEQKVDNLSRIRVLPKINSIYSKSYENSRVSSIFSTKESQKSVKSSKSTLNSKSLIDLNSNPINPLKKVHNFLEFNDFNNSETVSLSSELNYSLNDEKSLTQEKVANNSNTNKTENVLKPKYDSNNNTILTKSCTSGLKPINYFGPKICCDRSPNSSQLYFQTEVKEIENISTIFLKFSSDEINAYKLLIQIIKQNKHLFENENSRVDLNKTWKTLSEEMMRNCGITWKPKKCMDSFIGSVNIYIKVLENTPNYEIATQIYPLFQFIHSLDLKYFIRAKTFKNIMQLCEKFELKNTKRQKSFNLKTSLTEKNMINTNLNAISIKTQSSVVSLTSEATDYCQKSENLKNVDSMNERWKLRDCDINSFQSMIETVQSIIAQFGRNVKNFWQLVSDQMIANGYNELSAEKCRNKFDNYVCDYYKEALIHSPDYKTAISSYPLFDFIYKLDLNSMLNIRRFRKIDEKRQEFDIRIGLTEENKQNENMSVCYAIQSNTKESQNQLSDQTKLGSLNAKLKVFNDSNFNSSVSQTEQSLIENYRRDERREDQKKDCSLWLRKMSELSDSDIKSFDSMIKIIESINAKLGGNVTNFWELVSNQMKANGYHESSAEECKNKFNIYVCSYYKEALIHSPDYKTATSSYPLFEFIYKLDLNSMLKSRRFRKIDEKRREFDIRIGLTEEKDMKTKLSENTSAYNGIQSIRKESQNQLSDQTKSDSMFKVYDRINAIKLEENDYLDENIDENTNLNVNSIKTEPSIVQLTNEKTTDSEKPKDYKKESWLRKMSKLKDSDIIAFYPMIEIIQSIITQFGANDEKFWPLVSDQMKDVGYHEFSADKCRNNYFNYVCDYYKEALIYSPDYKTATSVYPLFDFIYKLDLNFLLSSKILKKINQKRQEFDMRIGLTEENELKTKENENNRKESQNELLDVTKLDSLNAKLNAIKLDQNEGKHVLIENCRFQTVIDFTLKETIKRFVIIVTVKYDNTSGLLPKKSTHLSTIKFRFLKLSPEDITIFHSIVQFINESKEYFLEDFKSDYKWMRVSDKMLEIGYEEFTAMKCMQFFQTSKSIYIRLLQYTPNYKMASQIFPLFPAFHSMDLKCLSKAKTFNKIMILKNRPEFESNVF